MRKLIAIGLIALLCSGTVFANTGVAFVHGTSEQTDALNDYWKPEFVNSVRQGLPNSANFVVVNCDFSQFMWTADAAGCLAGTLSNFITSRNITDLVVITHSNGSNVMRWILSNPTWDSRYPLIIDRIRWVNAVAASSLGTPLANAVMQGTVFESILGWILGFQNDAVRMQQTSWMAFYNANWLLGTAARPALPVGFWNVVGTDVSSFIFNQSGLCGGLQFQVALEITQAWLDNCSDGFLECTSQNGAGSLWFVDTWATNRGRVLSHHQSRRACHDLDVILRNDL
ncbi:MAG: hypothetical protein LC637_08925 [Xanthomonadaceae bacterium]|nr:hypothetical protein [Xanthomonadaceae bacterium]